MEEETVKGEVALRKMARKALGKSSGSPSDSEKDPLEEAQKFTKQMAANTLIESELAKSKASVVKAEAEAEEAKAKAERARTGSSDKPAESGIKATGEINLGKFNVQELLTKQITDRDQLKQEAEESASRQQVISDDLRERLHASEIKVLETSFTAQMQVLTKMIESNVSKGSFMEQYNGMIEMAKMLGFAQPQGASDITAQLQLSKLQFDQNLELKRYAREEKRADREFQRQLKNDDDERVVKKAEAEQQSKRNEMFAKAPEAIGRAIGSAVTERAKVGGAVQGKVSTYKIEIPAGASGEMDCPSCKEVIGIGETANSTVCARCGSQIQFKRIKEEPVAEEEK